jgi:dihydroneopterin aldolase
MPGIITIRLNHLRFFAFHGLFQEEQKIGNEFELNIEASYETSAEIIKGIDETVNYSALFEIVKIRMKHPTPLLETVAMEIVDAFHVAFPQLNKIEVSIKKLHPPIEQFIGNVEVTFSRVY